MADEVHSLRTGSDDESLLFQQILAQVENRHAGHQGVFVVTPGGKCLSSAAGFADATKVRGALDSGLTQWNQLSETERMGGLPLDEFKTARADAQYPESGLVLCVTARDVGQSPGENRSDRWSRSFIWFNQAEMKSLLPANATPAAVQPWPNALELRVARFALLDKGLVDGFTHPFSVDEVLKTEFISKVTAFSENTIELSISGETLTDAADARPFFDRNRVFNRPLGRRGVATRILGTATFDLADGRFTKFEMVAIGTRMGGAFFGRSEDDWSPSPRGFSFALGTGRPEDRIAAEFIDQYGW